MRYLAVAIVAIAVALLSNLSWTNEAIASNQSLPAIWVEAGLGQPFTVGEGTIWENAYPRYACPFPEWPRREFTKHNGWVSVKRLAADGIDWTHKISNGALSGLTHNSTAVFTIRLAKPSQHVVTLTYATADHGSGRGTSRKFIQDYMWDGTQDYIATSGQVVFQPGQVQKFVYVALINDCVNDTSERLVLGIGRPNVAGGTGDPALEAHWDAGRVVAQNYYVIKNHDKASATKSTQATPSPTATTTPVPKPKVQVVPTPTEVPSQQQKKSPPTPTPTPTPTAVPRDQQEESPPTPTPTPVPTAVPTATAIPTATPEPTPVSILSRYDTNGNGVIDGAECQRVIEDYKAWRINTPQLLELRKTWACN